MAKANNKELELVFLKAHIDQDQNYEILKWEFYNSL